VDDAHGTRSDSPSVPPLRMLYLYISGGCNLRCRHCWITPGYDPDASSAAYLPLEILEAAVEEAIPLGLGSVKLTGGEPMLHPRFGRIVDLLASKRIGIMMETNGILLDAPAARMMRESGVFGTISVSVDGACGETHDSLRGIDGSFEMALEGIRRLVSEGFRPQMICTLHEGNAAEMHGVVALAADLGCGSVKFNHVQVVGRGEGMPGRLPLTRLLELYRNLRKTAHDFPRLRIVFDIPPAFRSVGELLEGGAGSCRILGILGILPGGEMAMCGIGTAIPDLVYGRLPDDGLAEVWAGSPGLRELRRIIPDSITGVCAGCIHRNACMGVCPAGNYHRTGRLDVSYSFCEEAAASGLFPETRLFGPPTG